VSRILGAGTGFKVLAFSVLTIALGSSQRTESPSNLAAGSSGGSLPAMPLPTEPPEEELVSVALIREDLRQLLLASSSHLEDIRAEKGPERGRRLEQAIYRIASTADAAEWQPKYPPDE
jgi:hypothetical protein